MNNSVEELEEYTQEEYEPTPHDELMKISRRLIEKHREAYRALANV